VISICDLLFTSGSPPDSLIGRWRQYFAAPQIHCRPAEKIFEESMGHTVRMIGIEPEELPWQRLLTSLLRHPDPVVPELARQALLYLQNAATQASTPQSIPIDHAG
jgi:hypothetical protein